MLTLPLYLLRISIWFASLPITLWPLFATLQYELIGRQVKKFPPAPPPSWHHPSRLLLAAISLFIMLISGRAEAGRPVISFEPDWEEMPVYLERWDAFATSSKFSEVYFSNSKSVLLWCCKLYFSLIERRCQSIWIGEILFVTIFTTYILCKHQM